jgi:cytochrome c
LGALYFNTRPALILEKGTKMNRLSLTMCLAAGFPIASSPAFSADASAGKALFRQRCTVCHTAESGDSGGAQGPSLIGVLGRPAASAPQFSYTQALRESKLTWDAATLKRFLNAPADVVPGTSMALAVPDGADRDNLIAYFQSVSSQAPTAVQTVVVPASSEKSANWRLDAPGLVHRIRAKC